MATPGESPTSAITCDGGVWVFDVEADGLLDTATRVHCIAARNIDTREEWFAGPEQVEEALSALRGADAVVAHNFYGYDGPLLRRLHGWDHPACEDSLILSRLYWTDRTGGHSVAAWAQALGGESKVENEDWSEYTELMGERCRSDVRIQCRIVRMLIQEGTGADWRDAIATEYAMADAQARQEERGILLDKEKAYDVASQLRDERDRVEAELRPQLPLKVGPKGNSITAPFKKDGTFKKAVTDWVGDDGEVGGPFTRLEIEPFNFGSPQQVNAFLFSQGWVPLEWNYKKKKGGGYELNTDGSYVHSSPKLTEASFDSITGNAGQLFAQYRKLGNRLGNLARFSVTKKEPAGWLATVRPDGSVAAEANTLGTNTHRATHKNVVNLPKVSIPWGKEIRGCLIARPGWTLVGTDASGLEARVAGHFAWPYDDGDYAREALEGDIHTRNAKAFSEAAQKEISRQESKTILYASLYGAGARKLASVMGVSVDLASAVLESFWETWPGLKGASDMAKSEADRRGYVTAVDGRRIRTRSSHSAMNALFQATGSILFKNSAVLMGKKSEGRWHQLGHFHDEVLAEVRPEDVVDHVRCWGDAGREVTQKFDLHVPLVFESQQGSSYAEVH